jgi:hypothetical protein
MQAQHGQKMIGVGLLRNGGEDREIQSLGFGVIASLLGRQALMQQPLQQASPKTNPKSSLAPAPKISEER